MKEIENLEKKVEVNYVGGMIIEAGNINPPVYENQMIINNEEMSEIKKAVEALRRDIVP